MPLLRSDLTDFAYFLAIAKHRNFRRAGLELGVSASALSHSLKGLESRLGVRLLNRTNRSVTLTAAGESLEVSIRAPFEAIHGAAEDLNRFRDAPAGRIRLNVVGDAAPMLLAPVLASFVDRFPEVQLDIVVTNRMVDIVDEGFDAGIRYGGTVPKDMVAQRLSPDIRWVVAGAPAYLDRFGEPAHPGELRQHRCLRIRLGDDRIYRWEFERGEEQIVVDVPGTVTIDESRAANAFVLAGVGLLYGPEPVFQPYIASGELRLVLQDWASPGEGFHIYYSGRRQVPMGLKALISLIREARPLGL